MTYTSGAHRIAYRGGYVDNCETCVYDHEPHHRHDWDNQLPLREDTNGWLSGLRDDLEGGADGMNLGNTAHFWIRCIDDAEDTSAEAEHARKVLERLIILQG